jgi:two-component system, chemotaxis family, chemotaxis protein CheY
MPTVLIVDDEADIRFLVGRLLGAAQPPWEVAGEAETGADAIDLWHQLHPDVIVLDERMPGLSGLDTAERILAEQPGQIIVLFTAFRDGAAEARATAMGIRACVAKADLHRLTGELLAQVERGPHHGGTG